MAQPSVANYFNTRKRAAIDEHKIESARKVLLLDEGSNQAITKINRIDLIKQLSSTNEAKNISKEKPSFSRKIVRSTKTKKIAKDGGTQDIQSLFDNMKKIDRCVTPPNATVKEVNPDLDKIKKKICKSSRLAELKASINKFKEADNQLKAAEKRTTDLSQSPKLKNFKAIEFEVSLSPQKVQSPEKAYLSPKKEPSVRRNLLTALSPTKSSTVLSFESPTKDVQITTGLKLPFKYRTLAEIFRAIDTVSQILFNRKETITFRKLKPAVEEMVKRNLNQRHLSQIKSIYPESYAFSQEKLKEFGTGMRQEQWELVISPNVEGEAMTSEFLITRRRTLYEMLIDRIKDYHSEFLLSLTPPMVIAKDKITRWHPEFDLEKVPDIELADIPQPPVEEKFTSGKDMLEKARQMFNCNTRMEQALAKLKALREATPAPEQIEYTQPESILKGIPKSLLEKVRQKQAAKALVSMTRSIDKDKEVQMYNRLPEIARLIRNLFVTEKKGVLPLDTVTEKLGNSCRCFLNKTEIEDHLKTIAKETPDWLVFHKVRNSMFIKLSKNSDLSIILDKLEKIAKQKREC